MATTDTDTEMSMAPTAEAEVENAAPAPAEQQMEQPAPEAQPAQQAEQQQPTPDAQPAQQMEQQTAPEAQPPAAPRPQAPTNNGQAQPGGGHGVSMKALLEAGVHFGHQTKRWNPKMKPFIFTERNGIHILDLQQTVTGLQAAMSYVSDLVANGGRILFVGTKKQAQESIREESERANQPFINRRWMGGMLTNYTTIRTRLRYLAELEDRKARGEFGDLPKAEARKLEDQIERLNNLLGGIKNMRDLPDAVFIVDPNRERIAITESIKLGIPVVAMVDTNCDPDEVDYIIPSNDDAIRAVRVITAKIADAALEGQQRRETQRSDIDYTIEPGEYTFTPDDDSV